MQGRVPCCTSMAFYLTLGWILFIKTRRDLTGLIVLSGFLGLGQALGSSVDTAGEGPCMFAP